MRDRIKTWELALALSLAITLSCGVSAPAGAWWWGVIFPQLSEPQYAYTETASRAAPGEGAPQLRFRLLEWAKELRVLLKLQETR